MTKSVAAAWTDAETEKLVPLPDADACAFATGVKQLLVVVLVLLPGEVTVETAQPGGRVPFSPIRVFTVITAPEATVLTRK